jgi:hypothetical protein
VNAALHVRLEVISAGNTRFSHDYQSMPWAGQKTFNKRLVLYLRTSGDPIPGYEPSDIFLSRSEAQLPRNLVSPLRLVRGWGMRTDRRGNADPLSHWSALAGEVDAEKRREKRVLSAMTK